MCATVIHAMRLRSSPWLRHDFFVSYTRRDVDAPNYAIRLANRLRERHDVFLDEDGLEAGMEIEELERRVRGSAVLVVVASPSVSRSEYVPREVRAARDAGRRIVAIDIGRTLADKRAGLELQQVLDEVSWIVEGSDLGSGPSDEVVRRSTASLSGLRRRTVRTLLTSLAAALGVAVVAALWIVGQQRADQRRLAEERAELAARQSYARQLAVANAFAPRNPTRAAALLDDVAACPPERRELAWSILRQTCELRRWSAPIEWGAVEAARWLSEGELVLATEDGRVRIVDVAGDERARELELDSPARLLDVDPRHRVLALARRDGDIELRDAEGALRRTFKGAAPLSDADEVDDRLRARFFDEGRTLVVLEPSPVACLSVEDVATLSEAAERAARATAESHEDASTRLVEILSPTDALEDAVFVCNTQVEEYVESSLRSVDNGAVLSLDRTAGVWSRAAVAAASGRIAILTEGRDMAVSMGGIGFLRVARLDDALAQPSAAGRRENRNALARVDIAGEDATALDLSDDGALAFVGCRSGALRVMELDPPKLVLSIDAAARSIRDLRLAPNDCVLSVVDQDGALSVWSATPTSALERGALDSLGSVMTRKLRTLTRTPSGRVVYAAQSVHPDGGAEIHVFDPARESWVEAASFVDPFSDGLSHVRVRSAAIGSIDELGSLRPIAPAPSVALTGGGSRLFVRDYGGISLVRVPDVGAPEDGPTLFRDDGDHVGAFACAPDGAALVVARRPESELDHGYSFEFEDAAEDDPKVAASWRLDLCRVEDGARLATLAESSGRPTLLAWSPSGRWIVAGLTGGTLRAWSAEQPNRIAFERELSPGGRVVEGGFDAQERALAVLTELADNVSTVTWVSLASGDELGATRFEGVLPTRLCQRADGLVAAVGFRDGSVAIVERESGRTQRFPGDAATAVASLEFSDDGRTLLRVCVGRDGWGAAALCDGVTGQPLLDLEADGVAMDVATFLPGGSVLAIGSDDRVYQFRAAHSARER